MTTKHYDWAYGPAEIKQHSIAKHNILRSYLSAYFQTLAPSPSQDVLKLTLVDGFAGGGIYYHGDNQTEIEGSPFICLNATREAEFELNRNRNKRLALDVDYFFVESERSAFLHLEKTLCDRGYKSQLQNNIHLVQGDFQDKAAQIIEFIQRKSPRRGRSIFILDQYGYSEVPTPLIQKIFRSLPKAEVILTFAVDSFINFASDKKPTSVLLSEMGIQSPWEGRSIDEIKKSERDWRLFIQSNLYRQITQNSGAEFFTPFFIRNKKGHGDFWLIHMSQHHRARDVMTEVHWKNHNYFIHYGGAGLNMFQMAGYDPEHDNSYKKQLPLGFEFDDVAQATSIQALMHQIPRLIYSHDEGLRFGELFVQTCNQSPASAEIYKIALGKLVEEKVLVIIGEDGQQRRSHQQISPNDQITQPKQASLFIPF